MAARFDKRVAFVSACACGVSLPPLRVVWQPSNATLHGVEVRYLASFDNTEDARLSQSLRPRSGAMKSPKRAPSPSPRLSASLPPWAAAAESQVRCTALPSPPRARIMICVLVLCVFRGLCHVVRAGGDAYQRSL